MNTEKILKEIKRNTVDLVTPEELLKKLSSGKRLKIKLGIDPTSMELHLGHSLVLNKLKAFQDMGHIAILIIGDWTAQIGDPSERDSTRPVLDAETIQKNARTYAEQSYKILDKNKTEIRYNSEWLGDFINSGDGKISEFISISKKLTVSRLLEREDFKNRMKSENPISLLELLYPVFQGYDSVAIKADVELGGHDQIFNLLVGRDVQKIYGMEPQVVLTVPLLVGTDGTKKMSKSYGNYIAFCDSPQEIFGKVMSIPDDLMYLYYELLTTEDIEAVKEMHPMQAKKKLAQIITARFHDNEESIAATQDFDKVFSRKEFPDEMEIFKVEKPSRISYILVSSGLCKSANESRRMISQGGVRIDGEKISEDIVFEPKECVPQVGRRQFRKIIM
jgi:tyrosyl-tRNA synthetase